MSEPQWMAVAREYERLGTRERLPNGQVNPLIAEFFQSTKFKGGDADDAWCSAFVNHCMRRAGFVGTGKANARSWLEWGVPCAPHFGCVVVFSRPPKPAEGHVAFFVTEDRGYVHVLGGNQNNAVCIRPYSRARVLPNGFRTVAAAVVPSP